MKAILLAAGEGTRLRPLTLNTPKCLVPIFGKPLLNYWIGLFELYGISEVLINISYLAKQVEDHISSVKTNIKFTTSFETELLGSLGTVLAAKDFYKDEEEIFIFYADNLTHLDLSNMQGFHKSSQSSFTMGLFHTSNPQACGIAKIDNENTIVEFIEKPSNPESDLANAGIYILNPKILEKLSFPANVLLDIGYHLLPQLVNSMKGFLVTEFLLDVGTINNYNEANTFVLKNSRLFPVVE